MKSTFLPYRLTYDCNSDAFLSAMSAVFAVICLSVIALVSYSMGMSIWWQTWQDFIGAFLLWGFTSLTVATAFYANWLKRGLNITAEHYEVYYQVLGCKLFLTRYVKSDFGCIYLPTPDLTRLRQAFGKGFGSGADYGDPQRAVAESRCYLLSQQGYQQRLLICPLRVLPRLREEYNYGTNDQFISDFFGLPVVNTFEDAADILSKGGANRPPAASEAKPKGTFRAHVSGDQVTLKNHTGLYAGSFILTVVCVLAAVGAIPVLGLAVAPPLILLALFRELIVITPTHITAGVGWPFGDFAYGRLALSEIGRMRTHASLYLGEQMVVVEFYSKQGQCLRLPLGTTSEIGKMVGLSRLTMPEALWLVQRIKSQLSLDIVVEDDGFLWE